VGDNSHKKSTKVVNTIILIVFIGMAILCLLPFFIMFMSATKSRVELLLSNLSWWEDLENNFLASLLPSNNFTGNWNVLLNDVNLNIMRSFLNSLIIAVSASVFSVYFSSLTAYAFSAYRFRGAKFLYGFILAVLMVPTQVSIVTFMNMMYDFGWTTGWRSFLPLIVPAIAAPSTVFFMRQYMKAALPLELIEAGRIDGCSEFGIFNRLALPVLKPGIATMIIFALVHSWNNLFLPTILLSGEWRTIPIYVAQLLGNQFRTQLGAIYLGLAVTTLPLIAFYLVLSRHIISGITLGSLKE
jgi:multiple sugar transport system permease protein